MLNSFAYWVVLFFPKTSSPYFCFFFVVPLCFKLFNGLEFYIILLRTLQGDGYMGQEALVPSWCSSNTKSDVRQQHRDVCLHLIWVNLRENIVALKFWRIGTGSRGFVVQTSNCVRNYCILKSLNELEAFEGNYMVVWVRICGRKGWKILLVKS